MRRTDSELLDYYDAEVVKLIIEKYGLEPMNALRELMGPRADNDRARHEMSRMINQNGYVSLKDLSNRQVDKVALNNLDVYFTMQGFRTNLVYPMKVIPTADLMK